jgi:hypothetical protein
MDVRNFFTLFLQYPYFRYALLPHTGPIQDEDLLLLAWPQAARDQDITVTMFGVHFISVCRQR